MSEDTVGHQTSGSSPQWMATVR